MAHPTLEGLSVPPWPTRAGRSSGPSAASDGTSRQPVASVGGRLRGGGWSTGPPSRPPEPSSRCRNRPRNRRSTRGSDWLPPAAAQSHRRIPRAAAAARASTVRRRSERRSAHPDMRARNRWACRSGSGPRRRSSRGRTCRWRGGEPPSATAAGRTRERLQTPCRRTLRTPHRSCRRSSATPSDERRPAGRAGAPQTRGSRDQRSTYEPRQSSRARTGSEAGAPHRGERLPRSRRRRPGRSVLSKSGEVFHPRFREGLGQAGQSSPTGDDREGLSSRATRPSQ